MNEDREDLFWYYVRERRMTELRRRAGDLAPWSEDPIFQKFRFCNVYRASDRVSQYLIRHVLYEGDQSPEETIFRSILFRIFNLPSTWELLEDRLCDIPSLKNWSPQLYSALLDEAQNEGKQLWSGAYMMTGTGKDSKGKPKHWLFMESMRTLPIDRLAALPDDPEAVYRILSKHPKFGPFLGQQFMTDLGYAAYTTWSENDFVHPGPGAERGAKKLSPDETTLEVIDRLTATQEEHVFDSGLWLGGVRPMSKMDTQNCLCEFDKYTRVARPEWRLNQYPKHPEWERTSIKGRITGIRVPLEPEFFPPKWAVQTPNRSA